MNSLKTMICGAMLVGAPMTGCGPQTPPPPPANHQPTPAPTPTASNTTAPAWVLTEAPADAIGVAQIKADAKEGDRVVMRARIGGRASPITEGSPVMIVMDPAIPSCADNPADSCRTPWDYCCEPSEVKVANSATIQIVDDAGSLVVGSIASAGLEPLDEVIIVGVVGPRPDPAVLTVMATGVFKVQ